jgi:hypothetical protein
VLFLNVANYEASQPSNIAPTIFAFTVCWAQFLYSPAFTTSADQLVLPVGIVTSLIKSDVFNWGALSRSRSSSRIMPRFPRFSDRDEIFGRDNE